MELQLGHKGEKMDAVLLPRAGGCEGTSQLLPPVKAGLTTVTTRDDMDLDQVPLGAMWVQVSLGVVLASLQWGDKWI